MPPGLRNSVRAHNLVSEAREKILRADPEYMRLRGLTNPRIAQQEARPPRFDWRDDDRVTDVRRQGTCGSCWVFAGIAAYEAAHLIATNQTNRGTSLHVSEQQILDCSFSETNCIVGGWHEVVLLYLMLKGLVADG